MKMNDRIDVIATTISGSIKDWGKIPRIVPLFREKGMQDVTLHAVDSHHEARRKTGELVRGGGRIVISAGGSGTFNAVLEGCFDAGVDLGALRLGFLRKGSADLIGKVLGMPDEIEEAVEVLVEAIRNDSRISCDVLQASDGGGITPSRRFAGYGGAVIFGEIPRFTENRFIKYYKGIFSQLLGDLGPFFIGMSLATINKLLKQAVGGRREWEIRVDGKSVARGYFQVMIIVNGDLGPNLPFARGVPLGSGDFHLFALRDIGVLKLAGQVRHAWDATVLEEPGRWGFEAFRAAGDLEILAADGGPFPLNVDGSTMNCHGSAGVRIVDQVNLLAAGRGGSQASNTANTFRVPAE